MTPPPGASTTTDTVSASFAELAGDHRRILGTESGTVRFDVQDGAGTEHWYFTIERGRVSVSHGAEAADSTVTVERSLIADMLGGRKRAWAALLRGELGVEGDLHLLMLFTRLFAGPPEGGAR